MTPKNTQAPGSPRYQSVKVKVPQIVSNTSVETERYELAEKRRQARLAQSSQDDGSGGKEKNKLAQVREFMKTWSEHRNTEVKSNAEVPPLLQEAEAYDDDNDGGGGGGDNDPAKLFLNRRRSSSKSLLPSQPEQKFIPESFAEVVETVLPQHANTLQVYYSFTWSFTTYFIHSFIIHFIHFRLHLVVKS